MSEKVIKWEVEEGGPLYELSVRKGESFTELRLIYIEAGHMKNMSNLSLPNEMLDGFKAIINDIT